MCYARSLGRSCIQIEPLEMASVTETVVESMVRMEFGGRDFKKELGYEGSLLNGISAFQEEARDS